MKWLLGIPILFSVSIKNPIQAISLYRDVYSDCFIPSSNPLVLLFLPFACLFDCVPNHLIQEKKKEPSRVLPWRHHLLFSQISTYHICSKTRFVVVKAPFSLTWSEASCSAAVWATPLSKPSMKVLVVHLKSTIQWIPRAPSLASLLPYPASALLHLSISFPKIQSQSTAHPTKRLKPLKDIGSSFPKGLANALSPPTQTAITFLPSSAPRTLSRLSPHLIPSYSWVWASFCLRPA